MNAAERLLAENLALTVEQAARLLGVGRNTAYAAVRAGEIPSIRIGRSLRVPSALLRKMLETKPMNTAVAPHKPASVAEIVDDVIARGDLKGLSPQQRVVHYHNVCRSLGLNPLTQPFLYVTLNGKLQLYAKRDAADQLRKLHGINIEVVSQAVREGLLHVHVRATDKTGRRDEDFGVVSIAGLRGEVAANAFLKAVTKAKRRVTLSISGLGFLDESEVDDIAEAAPEPMPEIPHDPATGELLDTALPQDAADRVRTSGDDYAERWLISLGDYDSAEKLTADWNGERSMRSSITWPDDQAFARLKAAVTERIEQLKKPGLQTQRLEAQDT